jgi:uncharacterized protein HemY
MGNFSFTELVILGILFLVVTFSIIRSIKSIFNKILSALSRNNEKSN